MKKFIEEFKEFISRWNVVDLAVGVVVGGAFKSILDSLVKDIITPCISILTGKVNIADLKAVIIKPLEDGTGGLVITYGSFFEQVINFLIIAFTIFCTIKFINTLKSKFEKKKEETEEAQEIKPTTEDILLDIKNILENQTK